MWGNTLPKNPFLRFCVLMAHRYNKHNVAIQSAALAFYLLFTIFPFLIFISALLGLLNLDITGMMKALTDFLPAEVVELIEMYLTYVSENPSPQLMVFGLVFSVYFPMRATNSLMGTVRTAYHLGPPRGVITQWIKVLIYTVTLIVAIALTLSLMTFGERALWYAVDQFHLPEFLAWMVLSWLYSYYADHFSHYSVLYGSIGAVIVALIWLNLTAVTLILGAEMNGVLISMRKDKSAA